MVTKPLCLIPENKTKTKQKSLCRQLRAFFCAAAAEMSKNGGGVIRQVATLKKKKIGSNGK